MSDETNDVPLVPGGRIRIGRASDIPSPSAVIASLEVREIPFPEGRVIRWVPESAEERTPPDVDILFSQEVYLEVNAHVAEYADESGGFLLGNRYRCPLRNREYILIDRFSPAKFTEATAVSLAFTDEAWAKLAEEKMGKFSGKLLIGWYHSHPRMSVFLSPHDMAIHEESFVKPWNPALVITPDKSEGGFFCRRSGRLDSRITVEFFEYLEGADVEARRSVMRWTGYRAFDTAGNRIQPEPSAKTARSRAPKPVEPAPARTSEKVRPLPSERAIHWVPGKDFVADTEPLLFITQGALSEIAAFMTQGTAARGGILLGSSYRCSTSGTRYQIVDDCAEVPVVSGGNSVFAAEGWQWIKEHLEGKFRGKELLGWFEVPLAGNSEDVFRPEPDSAEFSGPTVVGMVIGAQSNSLRVHRRRSLERPIDFYELQEFGAGEDPVVNWSGYQRSRSEPVAASASGISLRAQSPLSVSVASESGAERVSWQKKVEALQRSPLVAVAGLVVIVVSAGAIGWFSWLGKKVEPQQAKTIAPNTQVADSLPPAIDIEAEDSKLVDPANPGKGLSIVFNLQAPPTQPPPKNFTLSINNKDFAPKDYSQIDSSSAGTVKVRVTTTDPGILQIVENRNGDGVVPVGVIDSAGRVVGARDLRLSGAVVREMDEAKRKEQTVTAQIKAPPARAVKGKNQQRAAAPDPKLAEIQEKSAADEQARKAVERENEQLRQQIADERRQRTAAEEAKRTAEATQQAQQQARNTPPAQPREAVPQRPAQNDVKPPSNDAPPQRARDAQSSTPAPSTPPVNRETASNRNEPAPAQPAPSPAVRNPNSAPVKPPSAPALTHAEYQAIFASLEPFLKDLGSCVQPPGKNAPDRAKCNTKLARYLPMLEKIAAITGQPGPFPEVQRIVHLLSQKLANEDDFRGLLRAMYPIERAIEVEAYKK